MHQLIQLTNRQKLKKRFDEFTFLCFGVACQIDLNKSLNFDSKRSLIWDMEHAFEFVIWNINDFIQTVKELMRKKNTNTRVIDWLLKSHREYENEQ